MTVALATAIYGEALGAGQLAGGVLVLGAVVILQLRTRVRLRAMSLPLTPPLSPQLARSRTTLPEGDGWAYEPKLDGFRALVFVDGETVEIASRNGKPLDRYFPEVVASLPAGRYVLDGEIVASSFDTLGQRIHPAKSRIERLSVETPARMVAFDLLALDDDVLLERPYRERRAALEAAALDGVELTPVVWTADEAQGWLLNEEGVIAKEADAPYLPGERTGMVKIKRVRTIDAVVVGWRPGKLEGTVGALILGLYEPDGTLRGVGHTSGFTAKEKRELPAKSGSPTRPASAAPASRRAGRPAAISPGSGCAPSSSSRSPSTTSATTASATARRSSAGAMTRSRRRAPWTSWSSSGSGGGGASAAGTPVSALAWRGAQPVALSLALLERAERTTASTAAPPAMSRATARRDPARRAEAERARGQGHEVVVGDRRVVDAVVGLAGRQHRQRGQQRGRRRHRHGRHPTSWCPCRSRRSARAGAGARPARRRTSRPGRRRARAGR